MQFTIYAEIKVLSCKRLSGISPPVALFLDRPCTIFLSILSMTGWNVSVIVTDNFCFDIIILGWGKNFLIVLPILSKVSNWCSAGYFM